MARLSEGPYGPRSVALTELSDAELEAEATRRRRARSATGKAPLGGTETGRLGRRELMRYYANLELDPGASLAEVKAAYQRLRAKYDPSRYSGDAARQRTAAELVASLTRAFEALNDHLRR